MVDKGFLVDDIVPCKVYRPAFLSRRTQMPAHEVRETQSIARLRVHVERMICRVKEHKLFDTVIPLTISGSINQLFACWSTIKTDLLSEHGPSQCKIYMCLFGSSKIIICLSTTCINHLCCSEYQFVWSLYWL